MSRDTKHIEVDADRLMSTNDAYIWADQFMATFGDRLQDIDMGLMIGWFANAMAVQEQKDHEARNRIAMARVLNDERPFTFLTSVDEELTLKTAVYQAIGAASNCWERDGGQGVFQDDYAREIAERLLDTIERWGRREITSGH
jgi:hypothetical protein